MNANQRAILERLIKGDAVEAVLKKLLAPEDIDKELLSLVNKGLIVMDGVKYQVSEKGKAVLASEAAGSDADAVTTDDSSLLDRFTAARSILQAFLQVVPVLRLDFEIEVEDGSVAKIKLSKSKAKKKKSSHKNGK